MRFRVSGLNWEGRRWTLVPSLVMLANQIDRLHPERSVADGTVASEGHDAGNPSSDHRPTPYSGPGEVRGMDVGETTEDDAFNMAEAIRVSKDKRVKYVIHEGRMFSSYVAGGIAPYTWRPYSGPNPHAGHFHISTLEAHDNEVHPWTIEGDDMPTLDEIEAVVEKVVRRELDKRVDGKAGTPNKFEGIGQAVGSNPIGKTNPITGQAPPLSMGATVQETLKRVIE